MIEIIKQAREQKAKLRLSFAEISRRSGIEVGSVKNFLLYEKNVRFSSAVAILSVLDLEINIAKKDERYQDPVMTKAHFRGSLP